MKNEDAKRSKTKNQEIKKLENRLKLRKAKKVRESLILNSNFGIDMDFAINRFRLKWGNDGHYKSNN